MGEPPRFSDHHRVITEVQVRRSAKGVAFMKATVNQDTCTGCGLCLDTCPEVFEMDGPTARVKVDTVPAGTEASCCEAKENCPVEAISIEE